MCTTTRNSATTSASCNHCHLFATKNQQRMHLPNKLACLTCVTGFDIIVTIRTTICDSFATMRNQELLIFVCTYIYRTYMCRSLYNIIFLIGVMLHYSGIWNCGF